MIRDYYRKK